MNNKHWLWNFLLAGVLCFIFSCATPSTTKLTSTKVDNKYEGGYLKSVLVVGVTPNLESRKIFEDTFVKQYKSHGVKSVSSLAAISPLKKLDKANVKEAAKRLGMEHIFVTHVMGVKEKAKEIPLAITGSGRTGIYIPSNGYNMPGLQVKETRVKLKNRIFELKTENMIWSATSESFGSGFDSASAGDLIGPLCEEVMTSLKEKKLLK